MRRRLGLLFLVPAAVFAAAFAFEPGPSRPTPTHVAGIFADGFRSGDFRQVCSVIRRGPTFDMATCAANLASGTGVTRVRVVPHSARVWSEAYPSCLDGCKQRTVEYAYVGIDVSLSGFGTARYRLQMVLTDRGWLIRAITVPPEAKG